MVERALRNEQVAARRREQILTAAIEVFGRKGYEAATIPEIAGLAGLAPGTIYIYYPGKRELFTAVIEKLLVTPLLPVFGKKGKRTFMDSVRQALNDRLDMLQSETFPRLMSLMGEIQRDPQLRALVVDRLLMPLMTNMQTMLRDRMAAGEFRRLEPEIVVRLIGGMMIGISLLKLLEGEASPLTRLSQQKVAQEIMDFTLHGLASCDN